MPVSRLYCPPEDFILRLRQRMPMNVGFTFSDEQLEALRRAFGDRFEGRHAVDMRGRIYQPWSRYYIVFQAGRDRRKDPRRGAARATRTAVDSFVCGILLSGLAAVIAAVVSRVLF